LALTELRGDFVTLKKRADAQIATVERFRLRAASAAIAV
jgi:hypothetical protein